jgi:hypothetical protein
LALTVAAALPLFLHLQQVYLPFKADNMNERFVSRIKSEIEEIKQAGLYKMKELLLLRREQK